MQITVTLSHTGLRTVKQTLKCFGRVRQQRRLFSQIEGAPAVPGDAPLGYAGRCRRPRSP